jgi:fibronectin-binding autotransporter adhesin
VTFDNSGSNNVPVYLAGTPQPALVTFNSSKNYTLGGIGSIAGTNKLIKTGSGTLTINNTNLYSGGTIISNSTVLPGNITANSAAWGTGPITLAGGTVQFNGFETRDSGNGWGGCTNTIYVPAGQTGTLLLPARFGYASPFNSPLTGGGTLNVIVEYIRDYFTGDWSAFTGQINFGAPPSNTTYYNTGDFRINNSAGYANAAIYLSNSVNCYVIGHNNLTVDFGELGGASGASINGDGSSSNPVWRIGARNTTNNYAGIIMDAGGAYTASLIKIGTGTFILSGANSYSGGTTISGGTLIASNSAGSATGTGSVTVNANGRLAGTGIIAGAVNVNANGTFAPGSPLGVLTLSNNLALGAGSTTFVQVRHSPLSNSVARVLGTLTEGGTLNVTNIGATAFTNGDSFKLFSAATYSGSFASFVLPSLAPGLVWNTNLLPVSGTLTVAAYLPPTIGSLSVSGGGKNIGGSGGIPYWKYYVLAATNLTAPQWVPVATNQFDASGNFIVTNLPTAGSANFYRLQLQ